MKVISFKKIQGLLFAISLVLLFACSPQVEVRKELSAKTFNYPVLKGKEITPVIRIIYNCEKDEQIVNEISVDAGEKANGNIGTATVYYNGVDTLFHKRELFGTTSVRSKTIIVKGEQKLKKGINVFWVCYSATDNLSLTDKISAKLRYVKVGNEIFSPATQTGTEFLRLGIALRKHNQDGVHTYRIPGLTTTKNRTLLAIYDVRMESGRDLQGDIDIGVSRSTDSGETWEPIRIALDMGEWGGLPEKFNGVSDANILVDPTTGDIYIAGLWMHGVLDMKGSWIEGLTEESKAWNHQWRDRGSQPGFNVKQSSQFLITKSSDDGKTWSKPKNLTKMCKDPKWWLWAPAPGHGITLSDGTLVFPTQGRDENGLPFSNITYSKDGGKTWITSKPASHNTTESMAVELSDGRVMLNIRDNHNRKEKGEKNGRAIYVTSDLGEAWKEHETSHHTLPEPVCMASIHRHNYTGKDGKEKSVLFFSNPNSKYSRVKQTIKVSFDDGKTWPEQYWMELDEGRGAGYSCITSINENTIGILYEGSQAQLTFQKIDVSELLNIN